MDKSLEKKIKKLKMSFFLRVMKLHLVFTIIGIMSNLLYANDVLSQARISLDLKNVDIETLFSEMEAKTGYSFLYKETVPTNTKVSVNKKNERVDKILAEVLDPLGLAYYINGKQVVITVKKQEAPIPKEVVKEKNKTISGIVVDKNNESLIGVSVMIKGAKTGTITDINGNYTIDAPEDGILVFSYVGLVKQEIPLKGKKTIKVTLLEDENLMNEVIVVGFGTQKKINLTGAVAVLDSKILENRPTGNAVQALQGAIPGLRITSNSTGGQLDASMDIKVRGDISGIGEGGNNPLILIDGMEGSLSNINPQDIDNISVLKDAASSAIYGTRAPYGVILVTTKSGKSGKSVVSYNNNFRYSTPVHMPKMANSWEFANLINAANLNGAGTNYFNAERLQNIYDYTQGTLIDPATGAFNPLYTTVVDPVTGKWDGTKSWANSDWLNEYYKKWSNSKEHNITVNGGKENITYYLSTNFQDEGGFLRYGDDNRQRYTMTGKISAKINSALKLDFISRFTRIDYDKPARLISSFFEEVLRRSLPYNPIITPDGQDYGGFIPVLKEGGRTNSQNEDLSIQLKATFSPVKNLNIIGEMNARIQNNWGHSHWIPVFSHYANDPNRTFINALSDKTQYPNANDNTLPTSKPVGSVLESAARYTHLTPNLYANYNFSLGKHTISPMVGVQLESFKQRTLSAQRFNLISYDTPVIDQTTSQNPSDMFMYGAYADRATLGTFGRINYDYDNRYLLEVNGRVDGSSRYRSGNMRWVTTPSVSMGWNIAREKFFKPIESIIPYLKLRASYGALANQNNDEFYPTYEEMNFKSGNGLWLIDGLQPNTASAPGLVSALLTWEKVQTTNFGVDWGFFNNRLTGSFDMFNRKSFDLMGPTVELPATLGTTPPSLNNTDLETTGFELEVRWKDRLKDFSYSVTLNLADDQVRVLKFPNPTGSLGKHIEGELTGNIYGYTTIGIAQTQEEMLAHLEALRDRRIELGLPLLGTDGLGGQSDGGLGKGLTAGDIMYKDINGDGRINTGSNTINDMGDLKIIGNTRPRYQTSAKIDFDWKGIDISMFWQGVLKRDFYPDPENGSGLSSGQNLNMIFWGTTRGGTAFSTAFKDHLDYFRASEDDPMGQNLDAYYPRPLFNTRNQKAQTRYLQNAAYLRLKNLQLGYTLPAKWTKTVGIQRFRIFGTAENLLTFTKMSMLIDPEMAGYGAKGGIAYPLSKTFAFGINVDF